MKKLTTAIVLIALFGFSNTIMCKQPDKAISQGCMSLQVPCDYKVENKSGAIGSNTSKMTKAYIADRVTLIYDEIIRDLEST